MSFPAVALSPWLLAWQNDPFAGGGNNGAADAAGAVIVLIFYGFLMLLSLAFAIFQFYVLYTSLDRIPAQFRLMEPAQVFLLLIPCFNLYWIFMVYTKIPQSFRNYFQATGRYEFGDCGEQLGMWAAIAILCGIIPCVGVIGSLAGIVMVIMLLIKFMKMRDQIAAH